MLLHLLLLELLALLLLVEMVAGDAAADGAEHGVMARIMAGDRAGGAPGQAADGAGVASGIGVEGGFLVGDRRQPEPVEVVFLAVLLEEGLELVAFLALAVAMVVGAAQDVRAQDGTIQLQGNVLQVGSGDGQSKVFVLTTDGNAAVQSSESSDKSDAAQEKSTYWVGILGAPVPPELRAQIDIPAGQGLLVRQIVAESPAVKAGLKEYDILLRGNDSDLKQMRDLAELVRTVGPKKATITLEVLRQET